MLHISDIKKYDRCEKLLWLSKKDPQKNPPFVFYNENLQELIKKKFHITSCFEGTVGDEGYLAIDALMSHDILMNARFVYDELRIKIPLMMRSKGAWDIYFTYATCYPKESEAQSMADHLEVLHLLKIPIANVFCIHLNADYVRQESLNVDELLVVNTHLYNHKNKVHKKIKDLMKIHHRDISKTIEHIQSILNKESIESVRSNVCTRGLKCRYIDTCFPQAEEDTSIMHLISCSKRYEMQKEGILDIKDVDLDKVEGTRQQFSQIKAAQSDGLYFDRLALRTWVDGSIQYPISYLDFEWETFAYPPYQGMKPFDVLCFQYSLHIEKSPMSDLQHEEYLGRGDCRESFIKSLLEVLPSEGSIMVFNMEGAEKLRLQQLKQQFPQYAKALDAVCERMVDLALPFSTANIYDSRMRGLFSLKTLVPIFSNYSYQDLDISYGMEAVRNWRMLDNAEENEANVIRKHLLEYCAMDTYAEVLVFHAILDILNKKELAYQQ